MKLTLLKNFLFPRRIGNVKYRDLWFRLILSVMAALYIVKFGQERSFPQLVVIKGFYIALAASFVIAFCLVHVIYWATCYLDGRQRWGNNFWKRVLFQCVLGIALPAALDILLAALYYLCNNIDIRDTAYFSLLYHHVVLFIIIVNLYYLAHYMIRVFIFDNKIDHFGALSKEARISWDKKDIVIIQSMDRKHYAYARTGDKLFWPYTIRETLDKIKGNDFFKVHKSYIVRRSIIARVRGQVRSGYTLILEYPFEKFLINVSQRSAKEFIKWWKNPDH